MPDRAVISAESRNGVSSRAASSAKASREAHLYSAEGQGLSAREAWETLRKSWPFISEERRLVLQKCGLIIFSLVFYLISPWPMKIVIDNVIDRHPLTGIPADILLPLVGTNRAALLAVVCLYLLVTLIVIGVAGEPPRALSTGVGGPGLDQAGSTMNDSNAGESNWNGLFGYFETAITIDLTQRINQAVRTAVYDRFLAAPLGLYADQKIGDAVFRAMHDSAAIGGLLYKGIIAPLASFVIFVCTLVILWAQFSNEPLIPIIAMLTLPIVAISSGVFGRILRTQSQRMRERGSDVMAVFEERLAQVQLIKAFGQEARESRKIDAASLGSYNATLRLWAYGLICIIVVVPLVIAPIIALVYHLMVQVIHGQLTLGDVTLLLSYGALLITPMSTIGSTWTALQVSVAGLRRVHSVLDSLPSDVVPANGAILDGPVTEVEFRDVALGYGDEIVLKNVSLDLRGGELTAIAGPSGAGKTTMMYAIPQFIPICAGDLLINGKSFAAGLPHRMRERIGFVFQQEALFSSTIADNIRYGVPDASDAEVARAAEMVGAAEFIARLPQGYATMLGRRGARLSVGQKQRIAIARAMLRHPDILILDEPMAPLDSGSESSLIATLRAIARDRIVLVVAHRPETLSACDRIFFVNDATVAASGSHDELLRSCPAYAAYLARTRSEIQS
jgi:ABC-type multidrug transport system fused ATPase/permease subunit